MATDGGWRAFPSPIISSGIYDGEHFDARQQPDGWSCPGYDDSGWSAVRAAQRPRHSGCPYRATRPLYRRGPAHRLLHDPERAQGARLGAKPGRPPSHPRLRRTGRHGYHVDCGGAPGREIYTPLRSAKSTDVYVLAGGGTEEWEPRFTFHGFRYVQVTGWPGDLEADVSRGDIVARVYDTDMERKGWFECSDGLVNRATRKRRMGDGGNFLEIPTDGPSATSERDGRETFRSSRRPRRILFDCSGTVVLVAYRRGHRTATRRDGARVRTRHSGSRTWTPIGPGAVWGDAAVSFSPFTNASLTPGPRAPVRQRSGLG